MSKREKSIPVVGNKDENVQERGSLLDALCDDEKDEMSTTVLKSLPREGMLQYGLSLPSELRQALNNMVAYSIHSQDLGVRDKNGNPVNMLQKLCGPVGMRTTPKRTWTELRISKPIPVEPYGRLSKHWKPLVLCVDGPDCSGKTTLLSLLEKVDLWAAEIKDPATMNREEAEMLRNRLNHEFFETEQFIRTNNVLCDSEGERPRLQNLTSFLSSYLHTSIPLHAAELEHDFIRVPLCKSWQHPNGNPNISPTGHTIRQWLAKEDALSGNGASLPAAGVQAAFTSSWAELMHVIETEDRQNWTVSPEERNRTMTRHACKSPVHLVDRSAVSMVVYGLLGGVTPRMLESFAKLYNTVPVLILAPSYSLVNQRMQRGDDAMETAEKSKPGMLHAVCSLYDWLRTKQLGWMAAEDNRGIYDMGLSSAAYRLNPTPAALSQEDRTQTELLQIWRTGIESELKGDGQSLASMVNLTTAWINLHLIEYSIHAGGGHQLPSVPVSQYLDWAYEWVLTWPGQWTPGVKDWFLPVRKSVLEYIQHDS